MTDQVNAALMRKLSAGQGENGTASRPILRALRLALARAAGDRLSLPLSVIGARQSTREPGDLDGSVEEGWLLLLFTSDHGGPAGFCLDPGFVSAIVQTQTIGEVLGDPPQPRLFTDTDAAMTAPLIEEVLLKAQKLVETPEDTGSFQGYEYSARLVDLRSLTLALIDEVYRVFDLTVELAEGARQGRICVLLPDHPKIADEETTEDADHGPRLDQAAGVIRAELQAAICRMTLPLAELSSLRAGDLLPLTGARLDRTEITTIDRARLAVGRLGQCGGMRAVRINEQIAPQAMLDSLPDEFLESVAEPGAQDKLTHAVPASTELVVSTDAGMTLGRSEQMVAEISQLAGLDVEDGADAAR